MNTVRDRQKVRIMILTLFLATTGVGPAAAQVGHRCVSNCGAPSQSSQSAPAPDPNRTFAIERVVGFRGEFYIITSDGRRLNGQNAAQVPLDNRAEIMTGHDGHATLQLPDGTNWTVGPRSQIVIDEFVYDPDNSIKKVTANLVKGALRWVTGHLTPRYKPKVRLPIGDLGDRGTDFECVVEPGGTGYVKVYSGALELTEYDSGAVIVLTSGQIITFHEGKITNR